MNTRLLMKASLIAALAAASMAPAASQASSKGLDACLEAFVKDHVPQNHPVRIVKRAQPRTMYMSFSSPEIFDVQAKGSQTGDSFGSATCIVDRTGEVVAMRVDGSPVRLANDIAATQASGG